MKSVLTCILTYQDRCALFIQLNSDANEIPSFDHIWREDLKYAS